MYSMKVKVTETIGIGERFTKDSFVKNINWSAKIFMNNHLCYAKYLKRFIKQKQKKLEIKEREEKLQNEEKKKDR